MLNQFWFEFLQMFKIESKAFDELKPIDKHEKLTSFQYGKLYLSVSVYLSLSLSVLFYFNSLFSSSDQLSVFDFISIQILKFSFLSLFSVERLIFSNLQLEGGNHWSMSQTKEDVIKTESKSEWENQELK